MRSGELDDLNTETGSESRETLGPNPLDTPSSMPHDSGRDIRAARDREKRRHGYDEIG